MNLWIYNNNLERVGLIDTYKSLIWAKRYSTLGDCELYLPATAEVLTILKKKYFIVREDDDMVCRIEKIEIQTNAEEGNYVIVTGYDCRKILNQRIIWKQTNFSGTVENFIRKIITDNVISPSTTRRRISQITLAPRKNLTDTIDSQATYDPLFDKISELCLTFGYGSRMTFNGVNFLFDLYKGVDRSADQSINTPVVFSSEYENLISTDYTEDITTKKTAALVAGEGEGLDRTVHEIQGGVGMNRFELYVDARDLTSATEDADGVAYTLTPAEYAEILAQRGREKLAEAGEMVSFTGEVEPRYSFEIGVDYFLGDIVTVIDDYGNRANARIAEVIETDDENGYSIIPTFDFLEVQNGN